jgi:subtilisin family serine protease
MNCFPRVLRRKLLPLCCAALLTGPVWVGSARAQLGVPRISLPSLPREMPRLSTPALPEPLQSVATLQGLRLATVRELLREHADVLEADPAGEPVRRHELLLVSPSPAVLDGARAAGFVLLREQPMPELGLRQVVLRAPPGVTTAEALARLRALDPQLEADFNHVYTRSGEAAPASSASAAAASASAGRRVGLIDSGIDRDHAALRGAALRSWGCAAQPVPSPHGTAVASLLVGRDARFVGVAPDSTLYAADIYCGQPAAGTAENITASLAWMASEQVGVVNISLVGPGNRLQAMNRQGHLLVAAVGNDGPAAAPLYPAAYPGVVGVTGVTPARRALPEAAQGAQVLLAAPGAELAVARVGGGYATARGTSFAAPLVAGLLAETLPRPDPATAAAALARVGGGARDLGAPGRDPVYGLGLVAEGARVAPQRLQAQSH